LDQQVGGKSHVIRSRRHAQDLHWRYKADPLHQYQILTARRRGELTAFVIFSVVDQDAYVIDLFGSPCPNIRLQLLEAVVEYVQNSSVQTLHAFIADDHNLSKGLSQARFIYRSETERVVAYVKPNTEVYALLHKQPTWSFQFVDILA